MKKERNINLADAIRVRLLADAGVVRSHLQRMGLPKLRTVKRKKDKAGVNKNITLIEPVNERILVPTAELIFHKATQSHYLVHFLSLKDKTGTKDLQTEDYNRLQYVAKLMEEWGYIDVKDTLDFDKKPVLVVAKQSDIEEGKFVLIERKIV